MDALLDEVDTLDLMDIDETCKFFGGSKPISRATLYRGVKSNWSPAPIPVGPNSSRWIRSECGASCLISSPRAHTRRPPWRRHARSEPASVEAA